MTPGIGGADASAPDVGTLYAQAGGGQSAAAPGPDAMLQDALGQVRQIGMAVDAFIQQYPAAAAIGQQITTLLKQAVVQLAQAQPTATPSGQAIPGGGA